jgi:hypothetical protein
MNDRFGLPISVKVGEGSNVARSLVVIESLKKSLECLRCRRRGARCLRKTASGLSLRHRYHAGMRFLTSEYFH